MTLREIGNLCRAGGHISLEVHAVDPSIYQVFQEFGGRLLPVTDRNGNVRFPSRYAAMKALADLGLDQVAFVHRSAYGEMIGSESPQEQTELRQQVSIAHLRD